MQAPPVNHPPPSATALGDGARPQANREAALARAEARGRQVLVYAPDGPLGGMFVCSRCGASALQPDLLDHRPDCAYRSPALVTLR